MQISPRKWQSHQVNQKALEKTKNSPFSLQLFVMRGHMYFSMSFWSKKSSCLEKRPFKLLIDQICKIFTSALNGSTAITKKN